MALFDHQIWRVDFVGSQGRGILVLSGMVRGQAKS